MSGSNRTRRVCTSAIAGLAMLFAAAAADPVGNTLFVYGDVKVERPQSLDLSKGDSLFAGDTIVTGARSRAQLLMKDGAKVALRPQTTFTIDEYVEAGEEVTAPDGSVVVAEESSAVSTLIKGGFRTITGAIGDKNPEAFEARTPVATLGIRGTDFVAVYCNAATSPCTTAPGIPEGDMPEDGLYVGASSGQVVLNNDAGSLAISPGQYAYVSQPSEPPQKLPGPPPIIYANSAVGGGEEAEEAEGESESAAAEEASATEESAEGSEESSESSEESSESSDGGDEGQAESEAVAESQAPAEGGGESAVGSATASSGGGGGGSAGAGGATASSEGASAPSGGDSFPAVPVSENPWSDATSLATSDSEEESDAGSDSSSDGGTAAETSAPATASTSQAARRQPPATNTESSGATGAGEAGAAGADAGSGDSFGTPTEPVIEIIAVDENGTEVDLVDGEPEPVGDPPVFRNVAFATGPLLQSQAVTGTSANLKADVVTGQSGASVRGFKNSSPGAPAPRGSSFAIGSANNFNVGFDPSSGLRWGRWSAGPATVTPPSASASSIKLAEKSLHWVVGPDFTNPPALPISGTATFDVIAGNTDPTDNLGNVGVLGSASLQANFTNQTVMANVLLSIAGSIWSGNGSSALNGNQFGGAFSSVLIDGDPGAGGNFSGFFTGGSQGSITGAGLSYALQSFDGTLVGGAVVFGPARP